MFTRQLPSQRFIAFVFMTNKLYSATWVGLLGNKENFAQMDKEEVLEAENLELRISEMKSQFQKSYDVFIKANEQLSKISFDSLSLNSSDESIGVLSQMDTSDINEIVSAGSVDACLATLRSKLRLDKEAHQNTFPDVSKLINIMNILQNDIESLTQNQKEFSQLTDDVNNEVSVLEKRMEDSIKQLEELNVESDGENDSSEHDECSADDEEEETFGSDSFSD